METSVLVFAVVSLGAIGALAAVVLYFVAQKFKVEEDPRIDWVCDALPGANCGGCGYAGCRNFAEMLVKSNGASKAICPACDSEALAVIAKILDIEAVKVEPKVAVLRCHGTKQNAPYKTDYEGMYNCRYAHQVYAGQSGCSYACLHLGDCVKSCRFGAMSMCEETGLPQVDEQKCTACGTCVAQCPREVIELRNKGPKGRRVYVSCINKEKGSISSKNCKVSCIGCGKCAKACAFEAIEVKNNLAYIDFQKCKLCRKCVAECPTGAIVEYNFPLKKEV